MPQGTQFDPNKAKTRIAAILTGIMDMLSPQLPEIPDAAREENAQDLLASGGGNSPEKMAQILKVAGRGLSEHVYGVGKQQTPQSIEELALEGSPVGKVIAGLPFASYLPKLTKMRGVGHGTTALDRVVTEGVDPSKFDRDDLLGWLFHAAEDPAYFNKYAEGITKNTVGGNRSGVLPLAPDAKNVLDLVEVDKNDLATTVGQLHPRERAYALRVYKDNKKLRDRTLNDEELALLPWYDQNDAALNLAEHAGLTHHVSKYATGNPGYRIHDDPTIQNLPLHAVAERLRLRPEQLKNTPFDAVRYHDGAHRSWAFDPEQVKLQTPYGVEIPVKRHLGDPTFNVDSAGNAELNPLIPFDKYTQYSRYSDLDPLAHARQDAREQMQRFQERRLATERGIDPYFHDLASRWKQNGIDAGAELNDVVSVVDAMPDQYEIESAQKLLSAWQYVNPGKLPPVDMSKAGRTVQALVPMRRIVLDKP